MGDDLEVLPDFLHRIFLVGFRFSHELENIFAADDLDHLTLRHLVSLEAFVLGTELTLGRKAPEILMTLLRQFMQLFVSERTLTIVLKTGATDVNKVLDREIDLGTWRELLCHYFEGVDEVEITSNA